MIKNLPRQFPVSALAEFDFGDAEAQQDQLLAECPVPISAIAEILNDKKDIILGFRGAGKSAIVRLIVEGRVAFKCESGFTPRVLCLNEEFDFRLINEKLRQSSPSEKDKKLTARVVWEILLIYRALQNVQDLATSSDSTLSTDLREIEELLGVDRARPRLLDILISTKKKVGVKLDSNFPTIVDLYASVEPGTDTPPRPDTSVTLRLVDYKRHLAHALQERKITLYVLFDRLDDFVAQEDYETQRLLLHGLLATQADYRQRYPRVKLKAFIRSDLFKKIDISEFGPDKVLARSVSLTWLPSDIREFVGKRIAVNLMKALQLSSLEFLIDKDEFQVTPAELATLEARKGRLEGRRVWNWDFWEAFIWLKTVVSQREKRSADGRRRSWSDVHNEDVITSILPTEVPHRAGDGVDAVMPIFKYFETHFQFGHGETTPRAMLSFLAHLLERVKHYYSVNPDIRSVQRDQKGEYPLFVKVAVREAYARHRKECWEVQYNWVHEWRPLVAVAERMSYRNRFAFEDFVTQSGVSGDEVKRFLAFSTHTGLLNCVNERERVESRVYEFPILFRRIEDDEGGGTD